MGILIFVGASSGNKLEYKGDNSCKKICGNITMFITTYIDVSPLLRLLMYILLDCFIFF